MNLKRILLFTVVGLLGILIIFKLTGKEETADVSFMHTKAKTGLFQNIIVASGELRAEHNVDINIPDEIMHGRVRIYDIKITDLVEEGTVVDSGDYVASLDHSYVMERIEGAEEDILEMYQNLENAKMDTNLNLTSARNNLMTDEDGVEERRIVLEQSVYESPSVQRQAQMNLDRAVRKLEQNRKAYELNVRKSRQRIVQMNSSIKRKQDDINEYRAIFDALNIKAPKNGMFIYARDGRGTKMGVGTMVSKWNPKIAELPDLSSLVSRTYVNEVDISRIEKGQSVKIGIDAFPEKEFEGEVISVSNIGQSIDSKTKVFEVDIRLFEVDSLLKPAMTTSNQIYTEAQENALYLPLDAVFTNDSLTFVYPVKKKVRQIVKTGIENENFIIILEGLNKGQKVNMLAPNNAEDLPWKGIEIYEQMKAEQEAAKAMQEDSTTNSL